MKELIIDAKIDKLDEVLDFVNEVLEASDCDMKVITQINIVVEEIFVNVANYAYNSETGGAVIRIALSDEVVIEFEDKGKPYNPLLKIDPDITKSAEERDIGGLGIFMVKKLMDSVEYHNTDNKNILTIRKVLV
jgi:anti-sigma regulatory factor (Ser/Thr protein kinase)